jgi:hypothetical protein
LGTSQCCPALVLPNGSCWYPSFHSLNNKDHASLLPLLSTSWGTG